MKGKKCKQRKQENEAMRKKNQQITQRERRPGRRKSRRREEETQGREGGVQRINRQQCGYYNFYLIETKGQQRAYRVFSLKDSIVILLTICAGREFQIFTILLKKKMLRFIQSKTLTNDLEAIVTGGVCEIGSYIVVYMIKVMEIFKNLNQVSS